MTLALEYLALDIKTLRYKEDFLKLKPPLQISGEQSGRYTVTQTRTIITNSGGQVSSTTNDEEIPHFFLSFYIYQIRALLTPLRKNKTNNTLNYSQQQSKA